MAKKLGRKRAVNASTRFQGRDTERALEYCRCVAAGKMVVVEETQFGKFETNLLGKRAEEDRDRGSGREISQEDTREGSISI